MTEGVYLIEHELGPIKIGRSENPKKRLKALQTGCPFELSLLGFIKPKHGHDPSAADVESRLHDRYSRFHKRGEWYNLPPEKRDSLVARCDLDSHAAWMKFYYSDAERERLGKMEVALR